MAEFGTKSKERLATVHPDLQTLFQTVVTHRDCAIISGIRTKKEQQALYAKGRTEPGDIVTYKDGVTSKSRHQTGTAVDVCPYPEMWDAEALRDFGNFVKGVAIMLKAYGAIDADVEWGGEWTMFIDRPHWQIS